jgi:hypothetical protein
VYVSAVVVSFIVVFLYCVCALFMCNVCYLSVVLLYYCHRVKAQLQFNKYIYIYFAQYYTKGTRLPDGGPAFLAETVTLRRGVLLRVSN